MSAATETLYTPDDLLTMPDGDQYELVDGHLVERHMSNWSGIVEGKLFLLLSAFTSSNKVGMTFSSAVSYRCFPRNRVRKPDVSFIPADRLPDDLAQAAPFRVVPDLAVEVLSPTDSHYEVDRKVAEYLEVGVKLVWVIDPDMRFVIIYRLDGSISGVREGAELDGEAAVPGFRCAVADLFVP